MWGKSKTEIDPVTQAVICGGDDVDNGKIIIIPAFVQGGDKQLGKEAEADEVKQYQEMVGRRLMPTQAFVEAVPPARDDNLGIWTKELNSRAMKRSVKNGSDMLHKHVI